jgi:hypothetical protein
MRKPNKPLNGRPRQRKTVDVMMAEGHERMLALMPDVLARLQNIVKNSASRSDRDLAGRVLKERGLTAVPKGE